MNSADNSAKTAAALDRPRVYVMYHELDPGGSEYSYAIGTARFQEHLEVFRRMRGAEASGYVPEITFDDGHQSNYEYAMPLLDASELKAVFFITASWTGHKAGFMGWEELRGLQQAGHGIGAHGWTHKLLTHCNDEELGEELRRSRLTLEDRLGAAVTRMSLPGGRYDARVLRACRQNGYTQVYSSEPKARVALKSSPESKAERRASTRTIGRVNIHGSRSAAWVESLLRPESGVLASLRREYRIKTLAQTLLGDGLYEKVWARFNRQGSRTDEARAAGR